MIIRCMECRAENDLTDLGVGVGHVLDCVGCSAQLRVGLVGNEYAGVINNNQSKPKFLAIPQEGPGARIKWKSPEQMEHGNSRSDRR